MWFKIPFSRCHCLICCSHIRISCSLWWAIRKIRWFLSSWSRETRFCENKIRISLFWLIAQCLAMTHTFIIKGVWIIYHDQNPPTWHMHIELILGLPPANERRRYFVTTPLTGWAQAWNPSPVYIIPVINHAIAPVPINQHCILWTNKR